MSLQEVILFFLVEDLVSTLMAAGGAGWWMLKVAAVWSWHQNRHRDQWGTVESPDIQPFSI